MDPPEGLKSGTKLYRYQLNALTWLVHRENSIEESMKKKGGERERERERERNTAILICYYKHNEYVSYYKSEKGGFLHFRAFFFSPNFFLFFIA